MKIMCYMVPRSYHAASKPRCSRPCLASENPVEDLTISSLRHISALVDLVLVFAFLSIPLVNYQGRQIDQRLRAL